ncbi:MAG: SDR family oxidoreductase [bacterium]
MADSELNLVTGAFSFNGKYITQELLRQGKEVITLTNHPNRINPFGAKIRAFPYNFDQPEELAKTLQGVSTIYNTYWIRFPYQGITFEQAIANTKILIQAAESAGVNRIVHLSVTNPSLDSPYPYFRG